MPLNATRCPEPQSLLSVRFNAFDNHLRLRFYGDMTLEMVTLEGPAARAAAVLLGVAGGSPPGVANEGLTATRRAACGPRR